MISQAHPHHGLGLSIASRSNNTDLSSKFLDAPTGPPQLLTSFSNSETPTTHPATQSPTRTSPRNHIHLDSGRSHVISKCTSTHSPISPTRRRSSRRAALGQLLISLSPKIGALSPKLGGTSPKTTSTSPDTKLSPLTRLRKRLSRETTDDNVVLTEKDMEEQLVQLGKRKKNLEPKFQRGDYGYYVPVAHWTDEPEI